jgi:beta-glucanase (GH16 family)
MVLLLGIDQPDYFKDVPEIIKSTAEKPLGFIALMVIALSVPAYFFFRNAGARVTVPIFLVLFGDVVAFCTAYTIEVPDHHDAFPAPTPTPPPPPPPTAGPTPIPGRTLVWNDEFNYTGAPNPTKWTPAVGPKETECNMAENVSVDGNNLVLQVLNNGSSVGCPLPYTGGRNQTAGIDSSGTKLIIKFSQQYGRMEARMKMPPAGFGAAFWMESTDILTTYGEIDVAEYKGGDTHTIAGGVNWRTNGTGTQSFVAKDYTASADLSADFHVYALEWTANDLKFFIDGQLFEEITPNDLPPGQWVYNKPYYLILSAGYKTGSGNASAQVDWVRVWQ